VTALEAFSISRELIVLQDPVELIKIWDMDSVYKRQGKVEGALTNVCP